jgi:hypothetical protein
MASKKGQIQVGRRREISLMKCGKDYQIRQRVINPETGKREMIFIVSMRDKREAELALAFCKAELIYQDAADQLPQHTLNAMPDRLLRAEKQREIAEVMNQEISRGVPWQMADHGEMHARAESSNNLGFRLPVNDIWAW